ncbi:MAG: ribosome-associated translation inhibitor RaiA [Candidatus Hydrogenedentota bacterium]
MNIKITGRNLRVTKSLTNYIEKKFARLDRFIPQIINTTITLSRIKQSNIAEAHLKTRITKIYCKEISTDGMYSAIDLLVDIIENKLKKENEKMKDKRVKKIKHRGEEERIEPIREIDIKEEDESKSTRIIKNNNYSLKPMFPEDAMIELQNSNQQFLVFINAQTEGMSVMYKRGDGNFGLIEAD